MGLGNKTFQGYLSHVTKMATVPCSYITKTLYNQLFQNQKANDLVTWFVHVAFRHWIHTSLLNIDNRRLVLTYFTTSSFFFYLENLLERHLIQ